MDQWFDYRGQIESGGRPSRVHKDSASFYITPVDVDPIYEEVSQTSPKRPVNRKQTGLCFISNASRCYAGILIKPSDVSLGQPFDGRSLCCYDVSQSVDKLINLLMLVKIHNDVKEVCRNCNDRFLLTTDISMTCKMEVSDEKLQLKGKNCNVGLKMKRTRIHLLYFYVSVNCSVCGNNVITAGINFTTDGKIIRKDLHCDKLYGEVTISVFSFVSLTKDSRLDAFISDTRCVVNDSASNRFGILIL
ncbi:uncharacterized protein LOC132548999 [Ylistrum balloti]|uniref:uncharacterized protein LOC132548999 n=1 Tax=Ylistrum balloti TaxID=509963 RepID=UPI002905E00D|nr:uncharacterized protein LOC132548999 [Ylistrum balloti]